MRKGGASNEPITRWVIRQSEEPDDSVHYLPTRQCHQTKIGRVSLPGFSAQQKSPETELIFNPNSESLFKTLIQ